MPDRQGKHARTLPTDADRATPVPRLAIGPACWSAVWLSLSLVASCASQPNTASDRARDNARDFAPDNGPGNAPKELLDEDSGTTLIVVRRPIVLARSRTDLAANVRDYVTLVVAQEDRSGKYSTWLIVHRWSTVDPRYRAYSRFGQPAADRRWTHDCAGSRAAAAGVRQSGGSAVRAAHRREFVGLSG